MHSFWFFLIELSSTGVIILIVTVTIFVENCYKQF